MQWRFSTVSAYNRVRGDPIERIMTIDHGFKIYLHKREKVVTGEIVQGHEKLNEYIGLGWFRERMDFFPPSSIIPITWY